MNKKITMYGLFAVGSLALFGTTLATSLAAEGTSNLVVNTTECNGLGLERVGGFGLGFGSGFDRMLQDQADILGISVDDLKALHNEGKTIVDILAEQGMDQESFHKAMQSKRTEFIQSEVAAGNITQDQADAMVEHMQNHEPGDGANFKRSNNGNGLDQGMRGMRGGFGLNINQADSQNN